MLEYHRTNDVTDRPLFLRPRLASAADEREIGRSAVRGLKATCSEIRLQWLNLMIVTVPELLTGDLTKAGFQGRRPRSFLTLDHRRNHVQPATDKHH